MRNIVDKLNSCDKPAAAPKTDRKSFQTYVTIYVPMTGSTPSQILWRKATAYSRDLGASGMTVVSRDDIRSPVVVMAFNTGTGGRFSVKTQVERRTQLAEGFWEYSVAFRGIIAEPRLDNLGKL